MRSTWLKPKKSTAPFDFVDMSQERHDIAEQNLGWLAQEWTEVARASQGKERP